MKYIKMREQFLYAVLNMFKPAFFLLFLEIALGSPRARHQLPVGRIVGGRDTVIDRHPYQFGLSADNNFFCGGVLIDHTHGITAAHCFSEGIPENVGARVGSSQKTVGGQRVPVERVIPFPEYDPTNNHFDIAILVFGEPIGVPSADGVVLPQAWEPIAPGELIIVTGWGTLSEGGPTSEILQEVEVPIVSNEYCAQVYGRQFNPEFMFCAGDEFGGRDACQGDSGGPAVNVAYGNFLGIVLFGRGCGQPGFPGVYLRIDPFVEWIVETVALDPVNPIPRTKGLEGPEEPEGPEVPKGQKGLRPVLV